MSELHFLSSNSMNNNNFTDGMQGSKNSMTIKDLLNSNSQNSSFYPPNMQKNPIFTIILTPQLNQQPFNLNPSMKRSNVDYKHDQYLSLSFNSKNRSEKQNIDMLYPKFKNQILESNTKTKNTEEFNQDQIDYSNKNMELILMKVNELLTKASIESQIKENLHIQRIDGLVVNLININRALAKSDQEFEKKITKIRKENEEQMKEMKENLDKEIKNLKESNSLLLQYVKSFENSTKQHQYLTDRQIERNHEENTVINLKIRKCEAQLDEIALRLAL